MRLRHGTCKPATLPNKLRVILLCSILYSLSGPIQAQQHNDCEFFKHPTISVINHVSKHRDRGIFLTFGNREDYLDAKPYKYIFQHFGTYTGTGLSFPSSFTQERHGIIGDAYELHIAFTDNNSPQEVPESWSLRFEARSCHLYSLSNGAEVLYLVRGTRDNPQLDEDVSNCLSAGAAAKFGIPIESFGGRFVQDSADGDLIVDERVSALLFLVARVAFHQRDKTVEEIVSEVGAVTGCESHW